MLEIRFPGVPRAGRERAFPITHLHQMAERVVGLVGMRLMPVIAVERRHRLKGNGELPPVRQHEYPGTEAAGRSRIVSADQGPR